MKAKFADTLWSSKKSDYNTPDWLFKKLNDHYDFETDPATSEDNPLNCRIYYTPATNGLDFRKWKGKVFINPPYNKEQILWVREAAEYNLSTKNIVIMLLPARPDTRLWQDFIFPRANL